ncbi:MAG: undecaprenyl/decaprenyl-phosphate alpha-N-acetylglucosaminyl 1-phosphate transferase [Phycisphaerales bacterium]|nr:undecaprenyl/decaprenyl-phosphate alpha-N-acetylglucosaminyl 1-phosphate transferase [Phycisphaerales bacterium]
MSNLQDPMFDISSVDISRGEGEVLGPFDLEYFGPAEVPSVLELLNGFLPVLVGAFLVTLVVVPIVRKIATANGIIDHPDGDRKGHAYPVAYLGGVGVFLGVLAGIMISYVFVGNGLITEYPAVPIAVVLGMFAIVVTGLFDDVWNWDPRLKVAGQLVAAAGLAVSDVGTQTAEGLLQWLFQPETSDIFLPFVPESMQAWFINDNGQVVGYFAPTYATLYYWVGVFIIAGLVLGACNAANLIDGLDGLLAGTSSIMAIGFASIAIMLAIHDATLFYEGTHSTAPWDPLAGTRIVIALSLLGATLGFLPYNFNPAVIFLGDAGSMLIGFLCAVLILSLGSEGNTEFVIAGLIVFALPIMDTVLAILRRKLSGLSMSTADRNHIHHMVLRAAGSVPRAVFALYLMCSIFVILGVIIVWMNMIGEIRNLGIYAVALVLFGFIAAVAIKIALRHRWMLETVAERNQETIVGGVDDSKQDEPEQKAG